MSSKSLSFMVENGLNLRDVVTTGSVLHIDQESDHVDLKSECSADTSVDTLGQPVPSFAGLSELLVAINNTGYVKKKIIEEGGGLPLHAGCTASIAFSGYWENEPKPFDMVTVNKPMVVDLKDNGLLPGLQMAIESMLVGETSVFLLSYQVMYGEMGIPPRIKPKADCVFYIKLVKSILSPKEGKIDFSEPNMFERVHREAKKLYSSGSTLHKTNNNIAAVQLFKKAVNMLHRCRLADEKEEMVQEKLLIKLYINLAVCYNKINKPLLACTACNELNRLKSLWNNGKALFQNAKALRTIGAYEAAEKRLKKAMTFYPDSEELKQEYELLQKTWSSSIEAKTNAEKAKKSVLGLISDEFKQEVDKLISNFKKNDKFQLVIPSNFNSEELAYFKEVCVRENLFFNQLEKRELPDYDVNQSDDVGNELNYVLYNVQ